MFQNGRVLQDRHGVGTKEPQIDDSQDWTLLSASENDTHTLLSFSRAFDTCDSQDFAINVNSLLLLN